MRLDMPDTCREPVPSHWPQKALCRKVPSPTGRLICSCRDSVQFGLCVSTTPNASVGLAPSSTSHQLLIDIQVVHAVIREGWGGLKVEILARVIYQWQRFLDTCRFALLLLSSCAVVA
jgi:hypothetical protein